MRITIQPQDDAATELGTDRELRRAFTVLRHLPLCRADPRALDQLARRLKA